MEKTRYKVHLTENYQNTAADNLISQLKIKLAANEEYIKELEEEQKLKQLEGEVKHYKNLYEEHKAIGNEYKQLYKEITKELKLHPDYIKLAQQVDDLIKTRDNLINKFYANKNK